MIVRSTFTLGALALALGLAACGKEPANKAAGDANEADPALTGALQDQILVDPDLVRQAKDHSALPARTTRVAPTPSRAAAGGATPGGDLRAPVPSPAATPGKGTLGELAKAQAGDAGARVANAGCARDIRYSAGWASRMPAAFPLYPDAHVTEAAGNDLPGCRLRAVSFTSAAPKQRLIDWYYTVAIRGGFSSEHQAAEGEHILAGVREKDGAAYYILLRDRPVGGVEVDLIATGGR